jgi:hypothetical protein
MTQRKIQYWIIPPKENSQFAANMENVLDTYAQPYDARYPVLCMDEQLKKLISQSQRQRNTLAEQITNTNGLVR